MAGRKPKPTHLHLVQGTLRRSRHGASAAPEPPRGTSSPPQHLSPVAKRAWRRFSTILASMGVLTKADTAALEAMCQAYSEMRECWAVLQRDGGTYETNSVTGATLYRSRPEVARLADADRRFKAYLGESGLTPAARGKVKVPDGRKPDALDRRYWS